MTAPRHRTIVCDVGALAADVVSVDALARLRLNARRAGLDVRLHEVSSALQDLLAFVGLADVLRVETGGQPEERK
jgi:STAS domain